MDIPKPKYKPIVLLILDGWGLSPAWGGNAITMGNPKNINRFWRNYPHAVLQAFKEVAGPYAKVGNSEVGHASLGAGRIIEQDLTEITDAIKNGSFFKNKVLLNACQFVKNNSSNLHLVGLLSDGTVHSHIDHLFALLDLAKLQGVKKVFIHPILDGQDVEADSGLEYLYRLEKKIKEVGVGEVATLSGRFYAMDRDKHWDRIELVFKAMVNSLGPTAFSPKEAIKNSYLKGVTDFRLLPTVILKEEKPVAQIEDTDGVIFFNFRADRARQLTQAFNERHKTPKSYFVTLTSYKLDLPVHVAFPPATIKNTLADILSQYHFKQLHVAESEKYAHVTYFFNGGKEPSFPDEDRLIIPSANLFDWSQKPEMSLAKLVTGVLRRLPKYDFIVANIPNVDMVGHSGNIVATATAVLVVDLAVKDIVEKTLELGGAILITADHGNSEQMLHPEAGERETLHTLNPVPLIFITKDFHRNLVKSALVPSTESNLGEIINSKDTLADVAPTILELFALEIPPEMTGRSLLKELR